MKLLNEARRLLCCTCVSFRFWLSHKAQQVKEGAPPCTRKGGLKGSISSALWGAGPSGSRGFASSKAEPMPFCEDPVSI